MQGRIPTPTADPLGDVQVTDRDGHPSSELCAVLLTTEDLDLASRHRDAAACSEAMGDGAGLARHAIATTRFAALSAAQTAGLSQDVVEPHAGRQVVVRLNGAGFDEDGRQWVPRRPTEALLRSAVGPGTDGAARVLQRPFHGFHGQARRGEMGHVREEARNPDAAGQRTGQGLRGPVEEAGRLVGWPRPILAFDRKSLLRVG